MSVELEPVTDEESSLKKNAWNEGSDDNAAIGPLFIAESLGSGEDYNKDPASLSVSDERYDEDSDLDNAGSQVSAEQGLHRPPLGIPPKHDSIPFEDFIPIEASVPFADIKFPRPPQQQYDQNLAQNLARSLQLYTKSLR